MDHTGVYKEIFEIFSRGKKSFGIKELGEIMQTYGMRPSELELQDMISQLDYNASGEVEFKEFKDFITHKIRRQEAEDQLREAFSLFDFDGNGYVFTKDLREAMSKLGERLSNGEIDEMLSGINCENEEEINIDEMISMLTSYTKD
ncbi:calmodulin, striated muscle-like protein [Sarcoptes scabiei]|nr:calmodulin, striated muscle-like protein [Sarcoptes scabiei]